MDLDALKNYIVDNDKVEMILESFGCHHIHKSNDRIACANFDGDNINAVNIYLPSLNVVNYTRDLDSVSKYHDIFTLTQYYLSCNFFDALKYICDVIGISTYQDFSEELPESLKITKALMNMLQDDLDESDERPLRPISEKILSYYIPCVNDMFLHDGITYDVQQWFEIGYDPQSNRLTIPIRNYDGKLIGVKGRLFQEKLSEDDTKYIYLEPCNKGQVLYGLDKTLPSISKQHSCFVGESEKFVMQLFSYGDTNCVSTGGKTISRHQIEMLSRLCVDIILCLDKDVSIDEIHSIADKFIGEINVYALIDKDCLLDEHESPSDDFTKWTKLKDNYIVRIR